MVKIGVCSANSGPYTTRDRLLELADAAEVVGLDVSPLPAGSVRVEAWILVAVSVLGGLMNFASPSIWERFR